ncbi:MAG: penicillin-binding protein 1C [Ketobacter sp.]
MKYKKNIQWIAGSSIAILVAALFTLDALFPLKLPHHQANLFARVVTDSQGMPLRVFPDAQGVWRYPISLDRVSPLYVQALLSYEDRHFWIHPGVNPFSMLRAVGQALWHQKYVSGGSTITMQVARLLHPNTRSIRGKLYQMTRAFQLEWHFTKKEILQMYLDIAPFGGTIEGVQAASYAYLNKPAVELTHAEAALLAVLPQSPTRFRPDRNPQPAQIARNKVLQRMLTLGVWQQKEVRDAMQETVYANQLQAPNRAPLLARSLVKKYKNSALLHSTIDGDLQRSLEDYISRYRNLLPKHSSLALLVVDNKDASVRAYVGTAEFGNQERFGYLDMVQAQRSPGSTLKPFLYAMGIEQGLIHSQSLLSDVPRAGLSYRPSNFSGGFNGPVSATEALRRSLNLPAVDLLEQLGPNYFAGRLQQGGLNLSIPGNGQAGLALILGGAGTSLQQLVEAYSALARKGQSAQLRFRQNDPLKPRYLLDPGSAWIVWKILRDTPRPDRLHTFQSMQSHPAIAWKTGTSYGFRDSWSIGVSQRYTVGVWVGRPDATPMPGHYGGETAAPLMFDVFEQLQPGSLMTADEELPKPDSVSQAVICWPLGTEYKRADAPFCDEKHIAWILDQTIPRTVMQGQNPLTIQLDAHSKKRIAGGCSSAETKPMRVALWPAQLEPWLDYQQRRHYRIPALDPHCPQNDSLSLALPNITGVEDGSRRQVSFTRSSEKHQLMPAADLGVSGGAGEFNWYINGHYHYHSKANQTVRHPFKKSGRYEIVVVDEQGQTDRRSITIEERQR